ncbi:hypothetical protein MMG03_002989 [Fibrobacter succinogenes]|nr:hypothetical protein [Fibrobacter succinogenes]
MPVEFRMETRSGNVLENTRSCSRGDSLMLTMAYDGSGRRVSKTRFRKACISDKADGVYAADWERELVTHYTGIGTEVRESFHNGTPSETKVVVNMPQGLGRYMPEDASAPVVPSTTLDENGKPTDWSVFNPKFEWYLKNHLGSTMLVYGTGDGTGSVRAAYDYRAFGEQVTLSEPTDKVTETFTGKELDDETELNYFGARYLDPMLGMWTSVDPKRQFASPYLYVGNGMNPINGVDEDGNVFVDDAGKALYQKALNNNFWGNADIRREYEFANTTSIKISLKRQEELIGPRELAGATQDGYRTQISLLNGVSDDSKMLDATVTLSNQGSREWSDALNVTFDEAEARTAAHEFGAHIRGASLKTAPNMRESVEHDNYKDVDQRLETPKNQCRDYE